MSSIEVSLANLNIEPMNGNAFARLSEAEITIVEDRIGAQLPEHYRYFLGVYGRSAFATEVNCTPNSDPLYFGWFFGFDELLTAIGYLRDTLPETIIPITEDGGGNAFCLGIKGKDAGRVYFHNHSAGWRSDAERLLLQSKSVPADIRYKVVHQIASTFAEFLFQMQKVDDE